MKTIKYLSVRVLAITALALVFAMPAKAQITVMPTSIGNSTSP